MQTILMNAPHNMNYELPASGLSPTWCTWFMPVGPDTNVYRLEPTSSQVNAQSNPMTIPSWQMTRICQDASGNFWASPPLLAGAGIRIAPAATGVTLSTSVRYIAGGTTTIPGTVSVGANDCTTLYTSTTSTTPAATGVQSTDVVSYGLRASTTSSGWANVTFRGIPASDQIAWNACNTSSSAYTPTQRDVNWYVLRHVQ
jgi:hypothetical protein